MGFSRYLNGPLPYIQRLITVNKMLSVVKWNISFLPSFFLAYAYGVIVFEIPH